MIAESYDLRQWADAHRFRWVLEESFAAEKDPDVRRDVAAFVEVRCCNGVLYPAGPELVAACVRGKTRGKLLALDPGIKVHQRGDQETTLLVPLRLLDAVAGVLIPKRRHQGNPANLGPEAKARGMAALALRRAEAARRSTVIPPGSTIVPGCDQEPALADRAL